MIVTELSNFDEWKFYLLTHKIKNSKHKYDEMINSNEFEYLKGRRYDDNHRIARSILGTIYSECNFDYQKANKVFLSLDHILIEPYIKRAVLESAKLDYNYTYEI